MTMDQTRRILIFLALILGLVAENDRADSMDQRYQPIPYVQIEHPQWSRDAAIYELNTRQFTSEGTFAAAQEQLPRLKALGVDIIWLMPVQEIGKKNRKGGLGSPYSVKDYYSVNPEFGDLDSLKQFVAAAHEIGLYVILDWVANHTAWDNPLTEEHHEWYSRNWKGEFHPTPGTDWSDIIELDYSQPGLRRYMTDAMKWWVTQTDVDGFRCDVAGYVPLDFWNNLRAELDAIKPVFMLAEWESRDLHARAFDMTYAWSWHNTVRDIAMGKADVGRLVSYYSRSEKTWPAGGMRMTFVSNHDKNSWEGTQFELFGDALENAIALSVIGEGMPLVYSGQEAGNEKRLEFFEKDKINWRNHRVGELYRGLLALKKSNTALWNGGWGARMAQVPNNVPGSVFSFVRANEKDKVFAVFNFSDKPQSVSFSDTLYHGSYRDFSNRDAVILSEEFTLDMDPWAYRVFVTETNK
jgi:glycosidase